MKKLVLKKLVLKKVFKLTSEPSSEKRNAFSFSSQERKTAENNDHFKSRYVKKRRKNIQFVASYFV